MRAEFERLVPLMKTGGFIPSVDHQTPPGVSLEQYRVYLAAAEGIHGCRAPVRGEELQGYVETLLQMRTLSSPSPRPSPLGRGRSAGRSKRGLCRSLSLRERVRVRGNRPCIHHRLPAAFQSSARIYFI